MGSARRRRKRAVETEVIIEQRAWDGFFWFTDRVSKRTGEPIPKRMGWDGKPLHDHRDDPMRMSLEERIKQTPGGFWFRRGN